MPLDARAPDGLTRQALTDVRSAYAQSRETGCTKQHSGHELALDPEDSHRLDAFVRDARRELRLRDRDLIRVANSGGLQMKLASWRGSWQVGKLVNS